MLKRPKNIEEDDKRDRYLITYADLITLLLGLFVILYASSQVDGVKYKEFSNAFAKVFSKGDGVLDGNANGVPVTILPGTTGQESIQSLTNKAQIALQSYMKEGKVEVRSTGKELILSLPEKLLFDVGKADPKQEGLKVLDTLTKILGKLQNQITIDGHTDSDPIRTFQYESNWHLSVQRALNVGYVMMLKGLPETNLSIRGFGAERPIENNSTLIGKAKNRRVEITITELPITAPSTKGYLNKDSVTIKNNNVKLQ